MSVRIRVRAKVRVGVRPNIADFSSTSIPGLELETCKSRLTSATSHVDINSCNYGMMLLENQTVTVKPVPWDDKSEREELVPERIIWRQTFGAGETQQLFIG